MEVTDDEGAIHLLKGPIRTVIVADPIYLIQNMPQSTRLVLCETNVRNSQYKTEVAIDHYL